MFAYVLKRIGLMIVTLWFVISVTFFSMSFIPGNPYPNGEKLTKEQIEINDHIYGFDRNIFVRYADYMTGLVGLQGVILIDGEESDSIFGFDMGYSFTKTSDVGPIISDAYPLSFTIGFMSLIFGSIVGITLGLIASLRKNGPFDYLATILAVIGSSFPSFIFAAYLQNATSTYSWLPFPSLFQRGDLISFVLPVISLSVYAIAQTARVTRTEMVEVLGSNFITLGRAKGVSNSKIVFGYAFRNSMIAILTVFGPLMVSLTTGSLVVEKIFGIPGMGDLLTNAVLGNDTFMVLGVTIFISIQIMIMYLIVDLLYAVVDPRIRVGGSK